MAEIIQLRRDTSGSWMRINPVLAQGEMGFEIDTNRFKIGNGRDAWTTLPYFASNDIQVETMPTDRDFGRIVQYIGQTTSSYTNGYFYQYMYNPTYVDKTTLRLQEGQTFRIVDVATLNARFEDIQAQYPDQTILYLTIERNPDDSSNNSIRVLYYTAEGATGAITTTGVINGVSEYLGIAFEGIPTVDENTYVKIYRGIGEGWNRIDVQPETEVSNTLTSYSITNALSANQGRVLKDLINNVQSIGRFLAIWDCNKNGYNARYLADGYQYSVGDYFIIGAVEEWNTDPDEGPVTVSFEVNNHVAASEGYTTYGDEKLLYNRYKPTTDATFKFTWNVSSQKWYDETKHTYINAGSLLSTIGFCPSHNAKEVQAADLVEGDYFEVIYTHTHNYFPVGDTYYEAPDAGCVRTYEDVHVSDMIFYDGQNWVLLANHARQIAVDEQLDSSSTNPVENRVVTNALNNKLQNPNVPETIVYLNSNNYPVGMNVGEGLEVQVEGGDYKLVNTRTSAEWGNIQGNVEDQSDLTTWVANYVAEHGGGGSTSEGMGTLNISNVFCRFSDIVDDRDSNERINIYKGDSHHILFTLNADLDYIKKNREDIYVTYSRRNYGRGLRQYRVLDDNRKGVDLKMYCWRIPTHKYYNSRYEAFENDYNNNYTSELDYYYFYTVEEYNSNPETLIGENPVYYFSDLRKEGDAFEDDNFSCGNWGTCFNELQDGGTLDKFFDGDQLSEIERYPYFDIDKIAYLREIRFDPKAGEQWLWKMVGRSYKNATEDKLYVWSHEWYFDDQSGEVFAYLDENDEPVLNRVPEDKRLIRSYCTEQDLLDNGWSLVEERRDLTYWHFTGSDKDTFVNACRNYTKDCQDSEGNRDMNWHCYFWDYPIVPVRISQCKILMADEAPHVLNEETGEYENDYADLHYVNHAFTLDEIEADEGLQAMLAHQKQLIFVYPFDTHHLWMRTFGWQKLVYVHHFIESNPDDDFWIRSYQWEWTTDGEGHEVIEQLFDKETGEPLYKTDEPLVARPWDRHSLLRGMFLSNQRDKGYMLPPPDQDINAGMGSFDNNMGNVQGSKNPPKWSMARGTLYFLPVEFNIATGKEISYNAKGKSTPFKVELRISGEGGQNVV